MQLDHNRFLKEGHAYVNEVVSQLSDNSWNELVDAKLSNAAPADIEGMKTLWLHGFHCGAEIAVKLIMDLVPQNNSNE